MFLMIKRLFSFFGFDQSVGKPALHQNNDQNRRKESHDGSGGSAQPSEKSGDLHLIGMKKVKNRLGGFRVHLRSLDELIDRGFSDLSNAPKIFQEFLLPYVSNPRNLFKL